MQGLVMGLTYFRAGSIFYLPAAFVAGAQVDTVYYKVGIVLAILAAISDMEGVLARIFRCESERGAVWDVAADKMYAATLAGIGWAVSDLSLWLALPIAVIAAYDMYGWYLRWYGLINRPCFAGKVKTAILFPALIAMAMPATGWFVEYSGMVAYILIYTAMFFACWSMGFYVRIWADLPDPRPPIRRFFRELCELAVAMQ